MINTNAVKPKSGFSVVKFLRTSLVAVLILALAGCFSSTKVYQTDKTITYKSTLYNMANVQKIDARIMGELPNGDEKNMKGMDKRDAGDLLDQHSSLIVSTVFEMDSQELVYQRSKVTSASQFSKMVSNFERAGSSISKFMANKKSTQLKLK